MDTKIENRFNYSVTYHAHETYSCEDSGCYEENICRCCVITKVDFKGVDFNYIVSTFFSQYYQPKELEYKRQEKINNILYSYDKDFDIYCIDRILRINKIWLPENWIFEWSNLYYGDEVTDVKLTEKCFNSILNDIEKVESLKTVYDKVCYLLTREYGWVDRKIEGKKCRITSVSKEDIIFPHISHLSKVKKENKQNFLTNSQIKGVCIKDGDKYRVIDGYHRIWFNQTRNFKIIEFHD